MVIATIQLLYLLHEIFIKNCWNNVLQICLTLKRQPHKMLKHTQKICRQQPLVWVGTWNVKAINPNMHIAYKV